MYFIEANCVVFIQSGTCWFNAWCHLTQEHCAVCICWMYICVFFVVLLTLSATVHCTSYMLLVVCSQSVKSSQNDASKSLLMLCVIGEGVTMALDDYGLCMYSASDVSWYIGWYVFSFCFINALLSCMRYTVLLAAACQLNDGVLECRESCSSASVITMFAAD